MINKYLSVIFEEATRKGYHFDSGKFKISSSKLKVTKGQLQYEFQHLLKKLENRDNKKFQELSSIENIETNKIFTIIDGEIESWEIV